MELLYKEEAYAIVGACDEVYNELGCDSSSSRATPSRPLRSPS